MSPKFHRFLIKTPRRSTTKSNDDVTTFVVENPIIPVPGLLAVSERERTVRTVPL